MIPAEQLLRALLGQAFYGIRSERQLMAQLDDNLLFRCVVGLPQGPAFERDPSRDLRPGTV
jgi:transposase